MGKFAKSYRDRDVYNEAKCKACGRGFIVILEVPDGYTERQATVAFRGAAASTSCDV